MCACKIKFNKDYDKALEAVVWLANENPDIDIYHVAKVLFYADKNHINKYGRPIIGDTYIHFPYGPGPSLVSDIITQNSFLPPHIHEKIRESLTIGEKKVYYKLRALRNPDISYFSKSDMVFLKNSLEENKNKTFDELYVQSHKENCYIQTADKEDIDYALFVDENNPNKKDIIKYMAETCRYTQV